jgi:hypothetical protein
MITVPSGWRFYGADFSREDSEGRVTLILDKDSQRVWNLLPEDERDKYPLFVSGYGKTLEEAVQAAVKNIV